MMNIDGFDYVGYLKRHFMVGQIDPWRSWEDGNKIYTLLVPVDTALEECLLWSNQEVSRKEFLSYLRNNGVIVLKDIAEFSKLKEVKADEESSIPKGKTHKRKISEERREQLRKQVILMNEKKKASTS